MRKKLLLLSLLATTFFAHAQNVGIGTTAPLSKLHISNGASGNITPFSPLIVEGNSNTFINLLSPNTSETGLLFGKADNAASGAIVYNNVNTLNGFQFRTNGNITQMILNNAGNVGIGVTTPNAKLSISGNGTELVGTAAGNTLRTNAGTLGNQAGSELSLANIGFLSSNNSSLGVRAYRSSIGTDWTNTSLLLGYDVDNTVRAGGGLIAISANGNIGIGTPNPLQKLHVEGASFLNGNVGVGENTPSFPLSFGPVLGDKISLWSNSTNSYGFGIQSGLLQIHTDVTAADIAFGYGASNSFTERARIINNGTDGMTLNGRLHIKNGSTPIDVNATGGVWLYKSDNSALLGFMGTQNNQNIGFYGGPAGWGFTYDAINSRVGIGNTSPNAPLSFPAALGKKITLYPGATGDVGMAVQGNLLQIYSDNPGADIAFGYDQAGTFTERFRVKANGSLSVNGSVGSAGQVLQSNGAASAATWVTPVKYFESANGSNFTLNNNGDEAVISSVTATLTQNSFVEVYGTVGINAFSNAHLYLIIEDSYGSHIVAANPSVLGITTMDFVYRTNIAFSAGSSVFTLKVKRIIGGSAVVGSVGYTSPYGSPNGKITAKVIPE